MKQPKSNTPKIPYSDAASKSFQEYRAEMKERLSKDIPEFESEWKKVTHSVGDKFIKYFKSIIEENQLDFFQTIKRFKLTLVIDNNVVLRQIVGYINEDVDIKTSFLYKILNSGLVEIYAPPKLKEELFNKIEERIPKDLKSKAFHYANTFLSIVKIQEAEWVSDWKKASSMIGHKDQDDIPYLALALNLGGHGIATYDKVFSEQSEVKVWEMDDLGKIHSSYKAGCLALTLMSFSNAILFYFIKLIFIIFKTIVESFWQLIIGIVFLFKVGIKQIAALPPWPLFVIGAFLVYILATTENLKEKATDFFKEAKQQFKIFMGEIREMVKKIVELLKELWQSIKPAVVTGFKFYGFLIAEYQLLIEEINRIEQDSYRNSKP